MILFVLSSLALGALALALLAVRKPVAAHVTDPATAAAAAARPSRGLVLALGLFIAAVAGGGYAVVGSPGLLPVAPDAPSGAGPAADAQLATLQARAERRPQEAEGWVLAARAQLDSRHFDLAAADLRHAIALRPADADLLADTADVLAAQSDGRLDGEPVQLVDRALAADPDHVKALALKGSWAMARRDFRAALECWDHALRVAPPGDPIAAFLRRQLDAMREAAARAAAAPASAAR